MNFVEWIALGFHTRSINIDFKELDHSYSRFSELSDEQLQKLKVLFGVICYDLEVYLENLYDMENESKNEIIREFTITIKEILRIFDEIQIKYKYIVYFLYLAQIKKKTKIYDRVYEAVGEWAELNYFRNNTIMYKIIEAHMNSYDIKVRTYVAAKNIEKRYTDLYVADFRAIFDMSRVSYNRSYKILI